MAIILSLCGVLLIVDLPNFFTIGKSFHIPKLSLILAALAALGEGSEIFQIQILSIDLSGYIDIALAFGN